MLLDFGAARKLSSGTWGTIDFSNTTVSNADILAALKASRRRVPQLPRPGLPWTSCTATATTTCPRRACRRPTPGMPAITSRSARRISPTTRPRRATTARRPTRRPTWSRAGTAQLITKQLVNGDQGQGWALYYDFGSADGCPQSGSSDGPCNNGWHVSDVGYVSFHGLALPLPEIYYSVNASQWTVVRKWWNGNRGGYVFAGATATTGAGLTPGAAWNTLSSLNAVSSTRSSCVSAADCRARVLAAGGAASPPRPSCRLRRRRRAALQRQVSVATTDSSTEPADPSRLGAAADPGPDARSRMCPSRFPRRSCGCGTDGS